jgi:Glycosyltransferase like family 2
LISYCVAAYRPTYSTLLVEDLIRKTSVPFEILLWLNTSDPNFRAHLESLQHAGSPIRIIGHSPENWGMTVYKRLFADAKYDMVVQIDDDVVCISPHIAEVAHDIFARFPDVGMLTANVWQDDLTHGARPEISHYRTINAAHGLYSGPIDGWFAVYRKSVVKLANKLPNARYMFIGAHLINLMKSIRMHGYLCTRMKVFHVIGPQYANAFGMIDFEIQKYHSIARHDVAKQYEDARAAGLPGDVEMQSRLHAIRGHLQSFA